MANAKTSALFAVIDDQEHVREIKSIWNDHPVLELMSIKFADFIGTDAVTDDDQPLLKTALMRSTECYQRVAYKGEELAIRAYTDSLVEYGVQLFNQNLSVETPSGEVRWIPMETTVQAFRKRYVEKPLKITKRPPRYCRAIAVALVMTRIVPFSLLEEGSAGNLFQVTVEEA